MTPTIAGLVLAAGAGNRLGTPKAALPWAGRTLLDHAVTRLRDGGCDPVHAVIGAAADRIRTATTVPVHFVHNPHWPDGMGGSLRAGLRALPGTADAVVVILVDQPGITAEAVTRIRTALATGAPIARAGYRRDTGRPRPDTGPRPGRDTGLRPGHPVGFAQPLWTRLADAVHDDVGARDFLAAHPELITTIDCTDTGNPDDIDTPAQLAAALSRLTTGRGEGS